MARQPKTKSEPDTETTTVPELISLPDTQLGRALLLLNGVRSVRPEAQIARVYVYKGNALMMLGVLFIFTKMPVQMLSPFCPASEEATTEREYRLRCLGVSGKKLKARLK